jgi:UPF0271 protein
VQIDLNSDVGESFGPWAMGEDAALIPLVTSVNVACGFHAGDPATIERTIQLARSAGAAVGAHPGYPDLAGFGRRDLDMRPGDVEAAVLYQVAALAGMARAAGVELRHVKPHGALYNRAAHHEETAGAIARAIRRISSELIVVGLAGSVMLEAGRSEGLAVAGEAFADRAYEADGSLRSRQLADSVHREPHVAAAQAVSLVRDGLVRAIGGSTVHVAADTLCLHGDTPGAAAIATAVRTGLADAGIQVLALERAALTRAAG